VHLRKFADDTILGAVVVVQNGCAAIQRDPDRLENRPAKNFMKFSKRKWQEMPQAPVRAGS